MQRPIAIIAGALLWCGAALAQGTTAAAGAIPRTADGHPDLSGVWWRGADIGGRGGQPLPGRGGPQFPTFASLYQPSAQAKAKTLADKDDPSLGCVPTAFGTLNVSLFDVGAVGQIVQTPKFMIMLTETYHGFQIIPFDGRPHRDNVPPSYRGDAVGRWEGDTFVVDKTNFTPENWMSAEGSVSFHSDALHIIERYRRADAKSLEVEATIEDPKVLAKPWVVPKQTLLLAPFDQIMELNCSPAETPALIEGAAKLNSEKH
ncbi:MAG TPA: hypothetical protein VH640_15265 [Bryobacteraceae bacterium]|jgi:hypothetical protein